MAKIADNETLLRLFVYKMGR